MKGVFGRTVTVVAAGTERQVVADEAYLRKSLLEPSTDIVKGFPPIMPAQKGQLTDEEIGALIDYLRTLK
jgi:cytochrome c oxidase subunit 2